MRMSGGGGGREAAAVGVGGDHDEDQDQDPGVKLEVRVQRPVFQQDELNKTFGYEGKGGAGSAASRLGRYLGSAMSKFVAKTCGCGHPVQLLKRAVPALDWLSSYAWTRDLPKDIVAGATVAIMHVPQGMAYALLGQVPAVTGIYMAFFPVLVYSLLGTSRHISVGTFAVVCLMSGSAVATYADTSTGTDTGPQLPQGGALDQLSPQMRPPEPRDVLDPYPDSHPDTATGYTPQQVVAALSLLVGCYQVIMSVFRLGVLSTLLSDPLVSGFSVGSASHAFTSQLRDLLGVRLPQRHGLFNIPLTYVDIVTALPNSDLASVLVCTITIVVLLLNNEVLKPWLSRRCALPVPIELIVVVSASLIANYTDLFESHGLRTIGHIPTGLPEPALPPLELLPKVALDAFTIAIVSYTIAMSLALLFGSQCGYEVDGNQELSALGGGNLVGALFGCMPVTASPSRSALQWSVGGRTQLASLVSCCCLVVVLLWVGPFFSGLPRCVLAGIILAALKPMLMQASDVVRYARMSWLDGVLWIVTFSTVVFLDLDVGLGVGVTMSLAILFLQGVTPYTCRLEPLPGTDIYVDTKRYANTVPIFGVQIFQFCGVLNFASQSHFKSALLKLVSPAESKKREVEVSSTHTIIVDLSAVTRIDPAGVSALRTVRKELAAHGITILLAGLNGAVFEALQRCCGVLDSVVFQTFPTIHDAVVFTESTRSGTGKILSSDRDDEGSI